MNFLLDSIFQKTLNKIFKCVKIIHYPVNVNAIIPNVEAYCIYPFYKGWYFGMRILHMPLLMKNGIIDTNF
ncbi:MAG: hypothetical protein A2161_04020 [Candidatus Schekmanbacteria bacterium RBG_13_48_7]|uniref:Uncharacterized protein n=1 Tax=Candidatus Schekmanbacteria bacterium RBG_13_48_7 TaxID=1817878 RepID=A0A1F7RUB0_9BACT|nr:MAG: hypothetical protein A2161_04020 [Candidatus Schekmanbacteria bacterium RBG_13_48_7]